ncbi:hypothetical protein [Novosphingobium sp.]|uniref:hypothetical protein n=1 Tax=Novosphingobium sp. TaxID=1874826 RepID=UPI0038BB7791
MVIPQSNPTHRRAFLTGALSGAAALGARPAIAAALPRARFDRAAYDRYVQLMNASDPRVVDFYADDIKFVMNITGKAAVAQFYARHRPFVTESLEVLFFCSDSTGAAAEVHSTLRCIRDCNDTSVFGRPLRAGETMRTHGFLIYLLNDAGLIREIKGPPPEVLQDWRP